MSGTFKRLAWVLAGLTIAIAIASVQSGTDAGNLTKAGAYFIALVGLSFLTGWSGQISIGNSGFMLVGGYAAAFWTLHHPGEPVAIAMLVAVVLSAVVGLIIGVPATRLRGPYLAGMTLAFAVALPYVPQSFAVSTLGGSQGLTITPLRAPQWFINLFDTNNTLPVVINSRFTAMVSVVIAAFVLWLMSNLFASKVGRAMRLVRDNDVAAELVGLHLGRTRAQAFVLTAALSGLAGALLVMVSGTASPNTYEFGFTFSIALLTLVVLGGIGSLGGAIIAALLGVYSMQITTWITSHTGLGPTSWVSSKLPNLAPNMDNILFGILLIVTMIFAPRGIMGVTRNLRQRLISVTRR
jgi:branched-chain amino acid transport system permease protein